MKADDNYGAAVWSSIESNMGVVCACLPTFKALIDRLFPSLLGHSPNRSREYPQGASALKKQGYIRSYDPGEVEMGIGPTWKTRGQEASSNGDDPSYGFIPGSSHSPSDSNRAHLSNDGTANHGSDIWKSTIVTVSRGQTPSQLRLI